MSEHTAKGLPTADLYLFIFHHKLPTAGPVNVTSSAAQPLSSIQ